MISDEYKALMTRTHELYAAWGNGHAKRHLATVCELAKALDAKLILDFGCGKGALVRELRALGFKADGYDPGVAEFEKMPPRGAYYDLVVSFDVLEHVEPEHIDATLAQIAEMAAHQYHLIALTPAHKILPDGRNAHLIVQPAEWWIAKFPGWVYCDVTPKGLIVLAPGVTAA